MHARTGKIVYHMVPEPDEEEPGREETAEEFAARHPFWSREEVEALTRANPTRCAGLAQAAAGCWPLTASCWLLALGALSLVVGSGGGATPLACRGGGFGGGGRRWGP